MSQKRKQPTPPTAVTLKVLVVDHNTLSPREWWAAALLWAAAALAPLLAGTFAYPPHFSFMAPQGLVPWLQAAGGPVCELCAAAALAICVIDSQRHPVSEHPVPALVPATAMLCGWAALSLIRSRDLAMSLDTLGVLFSSIAFVWSALRLSRNRAFCALLLLAIVTAAGITALLGIQEYLYQWKLGAPQHRTFSTFINPDFLAGYLTIAIPLTGAAVVAARDTLCRWGCGVALAAESSCLLLTGSRAGAGITFLAMLLWLALMMAGRCTARRRRRIGASLLTVGIFAVLASAPTLLRVVGPAPAAAGKPAGIEQDIAHTAAEETHSVAFRRYTWLGAMAVAEANPIIGVGVGTFEVSYPRYSITGYTAHAHNSLLQWMDETGLVGVVCLLTALAAAAAYTTHMLLRIGRSGGAEDVERSASDGLTGFEASAARLFSSWSVLLSGLIASIAGSLLHTLIDSDWYVTGTLITLVGVVALAIGIARSFLEDRSESRRKPGREVWLAASALIVVIAWRALATGTARLWRMQGAALVASGQSQQSVLDAYRTAVWFDPLDVETRMDLAEVLNRTDADAALRQLRTAVLDASIGKTWYRLGSQYLAMHHPRRAVAAYRNARVAEPHNLQTLHALAAEMRNEGAIAEWQGICREMAALENSPYGQVLAVPEHVETEYAWAHAQLGDYAASQGSWPAAAGEYAKADAVMKLWWPTRNLLINALTPASTRQRLTDLYAHVLDGWASCLMHLGATAASQIRAVRSEQAAFLQQRAQDAANPKPPGSG
ncbi:MAG: O-antigen ligase family protein [Armatimonadetes bacterium]|nr:O-antigen ligase family protein [Armatimonadota bacterium]MDE2205763.1 O-antigen ligase family protein [Armatimonadota bacterium]